MERLQGVRTWMEIDTKKLAHNYEVIRRTVGSNVKIMSVVKSNAYGHGLLDFAKVVEGLGVEWLGVDSIIEALRIRDTGVKTPILNLGYTLPERVQDAVTHTISLTVSSMDTLKHWAELSLSQPINIHIKVDTGLHRQGFLLNEVKEVINFLKSHSEKFYVEGLFTHFAEAKDPNSREYTNIQIKEFNDWITACKDAGFSPIVHASATAGALLYPEARFDMVRVGAGLYGIWPSLKTKQALQSQLDLQPILSWRSIISEIKKLPAGSGMSYDLTEKLSRDSTIAICPVGYWHGYFRSLSGKGEVLIHGKRAKVLGKIAMDMLILDITDIPEAQTLDVVTLIGKDGNDEMTADELADKAGSSTYEFLTRLNSRSLRVYLS